MLAGTDPARWGNSLDFDLSNVEPDTVRDVLISGELGPQPAAHGVLLSSDILSAAPVTGSLWVLADVTVYSGNANCNFLCDWRGQFSVIAQRIEVRGRVIHTRATEDYAGNPPWRFSASIGFGGWHAAKPLTYTPRERVLGGMAVTLGGYTQAYAVPKFARRFFPRLGLAAQNIDLFSVPATLINPLDVQAVDIALTAPGNSAAMYSCRDALTLDMMRNGIDVGDAGYVTLLAPAAMGPSYFLRPFFELQL